MRGLDHLGRDHSLGVLSLQRLLGRDVGRPIVASVCDLRHVFMAAHRDSRVQFKSLLAREHIYISTLRYVCSVSSHLTLSLIN